jgi:hypothetical protein
MQELASQDIKDTHNQKEKEERKKNNNIHSI